MKKLYFSIYKFYTYYFIIVNWNWIFKKIYVLNHNKNNLNKSYIFLGTILSPITFLGDYRIILSDEKKICNEIKEEIDESAH